MPGDRCTVCGNTKATDPSASFHRIPKDLIRRATWTEALQLRKETFGSSTRVCSRHFLNGDPRNTPSILLGKRLASPIKRDPRAKRAKNREDQRYQELYSMTPVAPVLNASDTATNPKAIADTTQSGSLGTPTPATSTPQPQLLIAQVGEQLEMNYTVHELPGPSGMQPEEFHFINQALLTRIEVLEENKLSDLKNSDKQPFCIEQLQHDDKLVQFYIGFSSGMFFQLLGPAVDHLNYWGSKDGVRKRHRLRKKDLKNFLS